jgi:hypothetical protein
MCQLQSLLELFPEQNAALEDIATEDLTEILNLHLATDLNLDLETTSTTSINTLGGTLQLDTSIPSLTDENNRTSLFISAEGGQAINGKLFKINTVLLPME